MKCIRNFLRQGSTQRHGEMTKAETGLREVAGRVQCWEEPNIL